MRRGIEDQDEGVLARIAVEHIHHFAADTVEDLALRGVHVLLIFVLLSLQLASEEFTLPGQTGSLFLAELGASRINALTQIGDLFVEIFEFILARRKLRLQLGSRLFSFGGTGDRLADADYADLAGSRSARRRRALRVGSASGEDDRRSKGDDAKDPA